MSRKKPLPSRPAPEAAARKRHVYYTFAALGAIFAVMVATYHFPLTSSGSSSGSRSSSSSSGSSSRRQTSTRSGSTASGTQRTRNDGSSDDGSSSSSVVSPKEHNNAATNMAAQVDKECVDYHASCKTWHAQGECERNPQYMREQCAASCGTCHADKTVTDATDQARDATAGAAATGAATVKADPSCSDELGDCTSWAAAGECTANPAFMFTRCASSCNACDRVTRCQWDTDAATPLGVPTGAQPELVTRALAPELARAFTPTVLSEDPLVMQLDSFLTPTEAASVAAIGERLGYMPSEVLQSGLQDAGQTMQYKRSAHRDSQTVFCDSACYEAAAVKTMLVRAEQIVNMGYRHSELQLLKYDVGQYYRIHHDYLGGSEALLAGPRTLTLFVYLSDVTDGGETVFPVLNFSVVPKVGRAVLWANTLDAQPLVKDKRTRHAALPVRTGVKYAANLWYYQRDVHEARRLGCVGG